MERYLPTSLPHLQQLSEILDRPISFVDLETTGMVHDSHFAIIEIGIVLITKDGVNEKSALVNPNMKIPKYISELTHIYNNMVEDKKDFSHYSKYLGKMAREHILCGYNSKTFDSKGMEKMLRQHAIHETFQNQLDVRHTFLRCRKNYDGIPGQSGSLTDACSHHGIVIKGQAHRAAYDIAITTMLAEKMLEKYGIGIFHKDIEKFNNPDIKKNYYKHVVDKKVRTLA